MAPLPQKAETPWYAETGLKFRCTACGACCTGAPGHVWVDSSDIRRMAKHKGMTPEAFARLYVRQVGDRLSLKERDNGDCVMLEGRKCSVYAVKPVPCSTFPFWDEVVETKEAWDATAAKCPGMGRGDVYEKYYRRVKDLHDRHGIPFRYADIVEWSAERRPAPAP